MRLLRRFPVPTDAGGLGDLEGCLDELGVDIRDRAEVGVSDRRLESTYFGFVIDFRFPNCSSEAIARALLAR